MSCTLLSECAPRTMVTVLPGSSDMICVITTFESWASWNPLKASGCQRASASLIIGV